MTSSVWRICTACSLGGSSAYTPRGSRRWVTRLEFLCPDRRLFPESGKGWIDKLRSVKRCDTVFSDREYCTVSAYWSLKAFVRKMVSDGCASHPCDIKFEDMSTLAAYCNILGEQIAAIVACAPVKIGNENVSDDLDYLRYLRNVISHRLCDILPGDLWSVAYELSTNEDFGRRLDNVLHFFRVVDSDVRRNVRCGRAQILNPPSASLTTPVTYPRFSFELAPTTVQDLFSSTGPSREVQKPPASDTMRDPAA